MSADTRCGGANSGEVCVPHVIEDHAVGVKAPTQTYHIPLHAVNPVQRQARLRALVVERDDLALQHVVERLGVDVVLRRLVVMLGAVADRKAVLAVIALGPPTIQDRAV